MSAIKLGERQIFIRAVPVIAKQLTAVAHIAIDRFCIGVNQQLIGVEAKAFLWFVRAVHAESIALSGSDSRQIAMPNEVTDFRKSDAGLLVVAIEETQFNTCSVFGKQRKISSFAIPTRAQGIDIARPERNKH